jgi:hypothetical protein
MPAMHDPDSRRRRLFAAAIVLSTVFWLGLATLWFTAAGRYFPDYGVEFQLGPPLAAIILSYFVHFLRRARWMARLRGDAVAIGPQQFRDLSERLAAACKRLGVTAVPRLWLLADGLRRRPSFSFAFAGEPHIVLNAEMVGAMTDHQGALDYFLGAELERLRSRERRFSAFLAPATVIPLLGAAFARGRIYAADRAGLKACRAKADAALALAYLAAGNRRWKSLNLLAFAGQPGESSDFFPFVIEIASGTPWLSRRIARLHAEATGSQQMIRARRPAAYATAVLVPRLGLFEPGAWSRAVMLVAWIGLAGMALYVGIQWPDDGQGVTRNIANRKNAVAADHGQTPRPATAPRADTTDDGALSQLDSDLKRLGDLAAARHEKMGGNPCEVGNITLLDLNFPASRYAFSCDEPVVYTAVEAGEFEPGKPSYLRRYNWMEKRFVGPHPRPPVKSENEKPSEQVGR